METDYAELARAHGVRAIIAEGILRYYVEGEIAVEIKESPCRFKDFDDGLFSMSILLQLEPLDSCFPEVPLSYWTCMEIAEGKGPFQKKKTIYTLNNKNITDFLAQQFHDVFRRYPLADVHQFSPEDLVGIVNLSRSEGPQNISIHRIIAPSFISLSQMQDRQHKAVLEQERKNREIALSRAREKKDMLLAQQELEQALLLNKSILENKVKSLNQNNELGALQVEAARLETAKKLKQLELMEIRVKKTQEEILQIQEEKLQEDEFKVLLQGWNTSLEANKQEHVEFQQQLDVFLSQFAELFHGFSTTAEHLKQAADMLEGTSAEIHASGMKMEEVVQHLNDFYNTISTKVTPASITETVFNEFKKELYERDENFKALIMQVLKNTRPALGKQLQTVENHIDFLQSVRQWKKAAILDQRSPVGISMRVGGSQSISSNRKPLNVRSVTYAEDPLKIGAKYKLQLEIPRNGYLWLFHFGRKIHEKPHLLYPFIAFDSMLEGHMAGVKHEAYFHKGDSIAFPDDVLQAKFSLMEIESTGGDERDRDAYVALLIDDPSPVVFSSTDEQSILVDVARGPMEDFSTVMSLHADVVERYGASGLACGMLEYQVR